MAAKDNQLPNNLDALSGKYGTFDITGTTAVTTKNFFGFTASDGAVIDTIKGIPESSTAATYATRTAAEVDLKGFFLTGASDPLLNDVYTIVGATGVRYIITNIKLTSGTLHCFKTRFQPTA
jgi:hypothetical protein